jgi:DNA-directed RNA polymerase specialized sigma24 family protein
MDRADIIQAMYLNPDISEAIGKMEPAQLRDDLRQEIFLVICELDEERLQTMHREGWLKYFVVRTMLNMIKSDRSTFYNKFRKGHEELADTADRIEEQSSEEAIGYVKQAMSSLHWYEETLMRMYSENGQNIAAISRETRIPYRSLFKTIRKVKHTLRTQIRNAEIEPETTKVRMRLAVEMEIDGRPDTDVILDHIDKIDIVCRQALQSETSVTKYGGFKIGRID